MKTKTFLSSVSFYVGFFLFLGTIIAGAVTITDLETTTNGANSRIIINDNFDNLNNGKLETTATSSSVITNLPNLAEVGTIATGTWNGSVIGGSYIDKTGDWTGTFDGRQGQAYWANKPCITVCASTSCDYVTDGMADDVQINQAISAGTGAVWIKAGTYILADVISLTSSSTVIGEGERTILRQLSTDDAVFINSDTVNGNYNITVRDMTLDGYSDNKVDANNNNGVLFRGAAGFLVENLYCYNMKSDCVDVRRNDNTTLTNWGIIRNNKIVKTLRNGISVEAGKNILIQGNIIKDIVLYGIDIEDGHMDLTNISINGNAIYDYGRYGIQAYRNSINHQNISITGNVVEDAKTTATLQTTGIRVVGSGTSTQGVVITGNTVRDVNAPSSTGYGIEVYNVDGFIIGSNTIFNAKDYGIDAKTSTGTIINNMIASTTTGIRTTGIGNIIASNKITGYTTAIDNSGTRTNIYGNADDSTNKLFTIKGGTTEDIVLVDTNKNVGIGLTGNPASKLHVNGKIFFTDATATGPYGIGRTDTGGLADTSVFSNGDYSSSAVSLGFYTASGVTYNPKLTVRPSGNVGIGTTTPNQKLTVFSSGADSALEFSSATGANYKWTIGLDYTDGAFKIASSSALGTNDRFIIDGNGDVGIGTSTPNQRLTIFNNTGDSALEFSSESGSKYKWTIGQDYSNGSFKIASSSALGTNDRLIIRGNGYVGINNNNPQSFLHISDSTVGSRIELNDSGAGSGGSMRLGINRVGTEAYGRLSMGNLESDQIVIKSNGKIGLGTSTPNQSLTIFNNAGDSSIEFSSASGPTYKWTLGLDYTDGDFKIASSSALGTNDKFVISKTTGYVGIGTSTINEVLDVAGNIDVNNNDVKNANLIYRTNVKPALAFTTDTNAQISLDGTDTFKIADDNLTEIPFTYTANGAFSFYTKTTGTGATERLNIGTGATSTVLFKTSTVGINTTTPTVALTVQGNVIADTPTLNSHLATKEYVDASGAGSFSLFFNDTLSDLGGIYYKMLDQTSTGTASTLTSGSLTTGTGQALFNFASPVGIVGTSTLQEGQYSVHSHIAKASGSRILNVYAEVYKRAATGTETLILTTETSGQITTLSSQDLHAELTAPVSIMNTDRLVVKFFADVSGVGTNITVSLYQEGTYLSNFNFNAENSFLSNIFVRQDGSKPLTADWDIGAGRKIKAEKIEARSSLGLSLFEDGGTGLTIEDGGDIGIGSTTPLAKFSIKGAGTGTGISLAISDSANKTNLVVRDNGVIGIGLTDPRNLLTIATTSPYSLKAGLISVDNDLLGHYNDGLYYGKVKLTENNFISDGHANNWAAKLGTNYWLGATVSSDGSVMAVNGSSTNIYVSTDYGWTWTARDSSRYWTMVQSSNDGKIMAATTLGGQIYTSTDYGATWTARDSNRNWYDIAVSSDGRFMAAVVGGGLVYTSSDYGATWTSRTTSNASWGSIDISSDGRIMLATRYGAGGSAYVSTDYGITWVAKGSTLNCQAGAISSDGRIMLVATLSNTLYVSTDYGANWASKDGSRNWAGASMTSNGKIMLASASSGNIYVSNDYGDTWTAKDSSRAWRGTAMSSNGKYMVATVYNGQIYNSYSNTAVHSGRMGIGTTTPNQVLTITNPLADTAIEFSAASSTNFKWTMGLDMPSGNFRISSSSAFGTNDRLTINGLGYVGINNTNPQTYLHITNSSAGNRIELNDSGASSGGSFRIGVNRVGTDAYGRLSMGNSADDHIVIRSTGNVGIGTSTPSQKLSVSGNVLADDYLEYSPMYVGDALTKIENIKCEKDDGANVPAYTIKYTPTTTISVLIDEETGSTTTSTVMSYIEEKEEMSQDWCAVDHNSLPEEVRVETVKENGDVFVGRSLGKSVQLNTDGIKELYSLVKELTAKVNELEKKVNECKCQQ